MGGGNSKSKSKLSRGKSEATVQTDVTIAPSSPQNLPISSNPFSTPQNRVLHLADPRSATAGIVRTPILIECGTPKIVSVPKPRYLETDLDEVLPIVNRNAISFRQRSPIMISMGDNGIVEASSSQLVEDHEVSDVQVLATEIHIANADEMAVTPEPSFHYIDQLVNGCAEDDKESKCEETNVEVIGLKMDGESKMNELFDKVIINCDEVAEIRNNCDETEKEVLEVEDECSRDENESAELVEGDIVVCDMVSSEVIASVNEVSVNSNNEVLEDIGSCVNAILAEDVDPVLEHLENSENQNEMEQNSLLNDSQPLTNDVTSSINNSRCSGECCCNSESWCQCDEATAVMLSSLRAIALKEPGEPTLPLPSLTESMSNEIFHENRVEDWLDENCDEREVFVDEETKAVAQQLLALSQSVGAYSRQLISGDAQSEEMRSNSNVNENVSGMYNNAFPAPQRNEGIPLNHYNLPRPSPLHAVYEDPANLPETPKLYSNAVKKLHFTPELSDSEKRHRRPLGLVNANVHDSGGSQASSKSQNNQDTPLGPKLLIRPENTPPRVGCADVENTPPGRKIKSKPPYSARWNDNEATVFI